MELPALSNTENTKICELRYRFPFGDVEFVCAEPAATLGLEKRRCASYTQGRDDEPRMPTLHGRVIAIMVPQNLAELVSNGQGKVLRVPSPW